MDVEDRDPFPGHARVLAAPARLANDSGTSRGWSGSEPGIPKISRSRRGASRTVSSMRREP